MYRDIVLFDDDIDDAELFQEALQETNSDIRFTHFHDEQKGMETLLSQNSFLPDLIFLDINMPTLSGWQCLQQLKSADFTKVIPVLMYTTSSQSREREIAMDLGASGFITKPTDFKNLKKLLQLVMHTKPSELDSMLNNDGKQFQSPF